MKPMASEITPRSGLKADPPPVHTGNYGEPPPPPASLDIQRPNAQPVLRGSEGTRLSDGSRVERSRAPGGEGVPAVHTGNHQPPINRTPRVYRAGKP